MELLKRIEAIDPTDKKAMQDLSNDVWSWIKGVKITPEFYPNLCFSRDALKAIRPECLHLQIIKGFTTGAIVKGAIKNPVGDFSTPELPTEELAELHAIIQAIEYKRLQ